VAKVVILATLLWVGLATADVPPERLMKLGLPLPVPWMRSEGFQPITLPECDLLQPGARATLNTASPPYTKWTRTCYYGGQSPRWVPRKLSKKVR